MYTSPYRGSTPATHAPRSLWGYRPTPRFAARSLLARCLLVVCSLFARCLFAACSLLEWAARLAPPSSGEGRACRALVPPPPPGVLPSPPGGPLAYALPLPPTRATRAPLPVRCPSPVLRLTAVAGGLACLRPSGGYAALLVGGCRPHAPALAAWPCLPLGWPPLLLGWLGLA